MNQNNFQHHATDYANRDQLFIIFLYFVFQTIPAHSHHAQGQLRPRGLHLQIRAHHVSSEGWFCCSQWPAHRSLHLRDQRPERHWTQGELFQDMPLNVVSL